jgi:hypothetical protein
LFTVFIEDHIMAISYALIRDTLPIAVVKPSDKKAGLFLVFHADHCDQFSLSKNWDWDPNNVFSILDELGNLNIVASLRVKFGEKDTKILGNVQKQLSLQGDYCYRSVLLRYGFISRLTADLISLNALESKAVAHDVEFDPSFTDADKVNLVNRLIANGKTGDLGAYVLGMAALPTGDMKSAEPTEPSASDNQA